MQISRTNLFHSSCAPNWSPVWSDIIWVTMLQQMSFVRSWEGVVLLFFQMTMPLQQKFVLMKLVINLYWDYYNFWKAKVQFSFKKKRRKFVENCWVFEIGDFVLEKIKQFIKLFLTFLFVFFSMIGFLTDFLLLKSCGFLDLKLFRPQKWLKKLGTWNRVLHGSIYFPRPYDSWQLVYKT